MIISVILEVFVKFLLELLIKAPIRWVASRFHKRRNRRRTHALTALHTPSATESIQQTITKVQRDSYLSVLAAILLGVLTILCILLWIASDYTIFLMVFWGVLVLLTAWAIWYYRRSYVSFDLYEFTYSELGDGIKTTLYAAIDSYVFTYDGFASTLKITTINDETFCLNPAVQDCRYLCSMLAVRVQTGRWVNPTAERDAATVLHMMRSNDWLEFMLRVEQAKNLARTNLEVMHRTQNMSREEAAAEAETAKATLGFTGK
jgi:hypothetical protein